jgi:hypothetical protein
LQLATRRNILFRTVEHFMAVRVFDRIAEGRTCDLPATGYRGGVLERYTEAIRWLSENHVAK